MKREIKFRAKNVYNGDWEYGHVRCRIKDDWTITDEYGFQCDIDEETIGEFTGLKDANGVEIYEGDIVQTSIYLYKVVFDEKSPRFVLFTDNKHSMYQLDINWARDLEIVGNVIDNPDVKLGYYSK